eukprot:gene10497-14108_t
MSECILSNFRENEFDVENNAHHSVFTYNPSTREWVSGNSLGSLLSISHSQESVDGDNSIKERADACSGAITCLAFSSKNDLCVIAYDNQLSLRNSVDFREIRSMIVRTSLPIIQVEFDASATSIFILSRDQEFIIYSIATESIEKKIPLNNGVRSFSLLNHSYLSMLDDTGCVIIYQFLAQGIVSSKYLNYDEISRFQNVSDRSIMRAYDSTGCKMSWYPTSINNETDNNVRILVCPSTKGSLSIFTVDGIDENGLEVWKESYLTSDGLRPESHGNNTVNLAQFSSDGSYLISCDMIGTALLWEFDVQNPTNSNPIRRFLFNSFGPLLDIAWSPLMKDNYCIAVTSSQWCKVSNVVPENQQKIVKSIVNTINKKVISSPAAKSKKSGTPISSNKRLVKPLSRSEDEDDDLFPPSPYSNTYHSPKADTAVDKSKFSADSVEDLFTQTQDDLNIQTQPETLQNTQQSHFVIEPVRKRLQKSKTSHDSDDDNIMTYDEQDALPAPITVSKQTILKNTSTSDKNSNDKNKSQTPSKATRRQASSSRSSLVIDDDELDDLKDDEDDDNSIMNEDEAAISEKFNIEEVIKLANNLKDGHLSTVAPVVKLQPPFQPSSTTNDEKKRRYLVWNSIGSIVSREEPLENRIEIKFQNAMGNNKPEAFPDRIGFTMASLSYEGAVFASESEVEPTDTAEIAITKTGSTILYHAFPGQKQLEGLNDSFQYVLPNGENALAVAVGMGWIAVATSNQLLRVFTSTGVEAYVLCLKGPIVTICGYDSFLGVIYHSGMPLDGTFQMKLDYYDINWKDGCKGQLLINGLTVPLSSKANLVWVGYDVECKLLTVFDSNDKMFCLAKVLGWQWLPILDISIIKKSSEHTYWPIMINKSKLCYVLLNGESKPVVFPQPVIATKPIRFPLVESKDSKVNAVQKESKQSLLWGDAQIAHLEAMKEYATSIQMSSSTSVLSTIVMGEKLSFLDDRLEKQYTTLDTVILKSLQEACRTQQIPLALSLALKLRTEKGLQLAITVANHFGRSTVAEFLDSIIQQKQQLELQKQQLSLDYSMTNENQDNNDNYDGNNYHQPDEYVKEAVKDSLYSSMNNNNSNINNNAPIQSNLTSRAGILKQSNYNNSTNGLLKNKSSIVSPADNEFLEEQNIPINPFAVKSLGSTPMSKRKSIFSALEELKPSPSPKRPMLNRQSSFSQQSRQQTLSNKKIL